MEALQSLQPTATRSSVVAALKECSSLPSLPPPLGQSVLTRLLEILQSYAASRLKPGVGERVNVFQSEAVAELTLEVLEGVLNRNGVVARAVFWTVFHHLLNLLCLNSKQASNEIREGTLKCLSQLLKCSSVSFEELAQQALHQTDLNNSLTFAVYKCFERIHEEHPRGDKEIARGSFEVLKRLLEVFSLPPLWFGILPSAASELSAFLTSTGKMIESGGAVLPWSKITGDAIHLFCALTCRVMADENVMDLMPVPSQEVPSLDQLYSVMQLQSRAPSLTEQASDVPSLGNKASAIEGSWEWFQFSGKKIGHLLKKWMPSILRHPHQTVRSALAEGVHQLLEKCQTCLDPFVEDLLRTLLILSQDRYPQALLERSGVLRELLCWFRDPPSRNESMSKWHLTMETLMKKEVSVLPAAIRSSAAEIQSTAGMLTAALDVTGGQLFSSWIIEDMFQLQLLYEGCNCAFSFDSTLAATLYRITTVPEMADDAQLMGSPKMPLALKYITDEDTYRALSLFIRSVSSSLCTTPEPSLKGLQLLLDACLDGITESCEQIPTHGYLPVASSVCVFSEVLCGAHAAPVALLTSSVSYVAQLMQQHDPWKLSNEAERANNKEGEHAFLVHSLLKWVGVCGGTLKQHLVASTCDIMPFVLLPVLERSVDPLPFLQSAAQDTLKTLCCALELPSLSDLILKFAPSVIEGLCLKLSDVASHPESPRVLAALLKDLSDQPGELLLLLSAPVSHALKAEFLIALIPFNRVLMQGVSIEGRNSSPENILPYLEALSESAAVVEHGAESVLSYLQRLVGTSGTLPEATASQMLTQMHHLKSTAILADSIVHLATPLFLDPHLHVCQLALKVCAMGLNGLRSATAACRLFDDQFSPRFPKHHPEAEMATPEIPQINSVITPVWRNLIAAIKRHPVVLIEGSLELFVLVATAFDGRTLSRRFAQEAWPLLKRLLEQGHAQPPLQTVIPYRGSFTHVQGKRDLAPQSKERSQLAALSCLKRIGEDPVARPCLKLPLAEILSLLTPYLSPNQPVSLQEGAKGAIEAVALVDVDYVWSILREAARDPPQAPFQELLTKLDVADVAWHEWLRECYLRDS